jgi:hypothetical protein
MPCTGDSLGKISSLKNRMSGNAGVAGTLTRPLWTLPSSCKISQKVRLANPCFNRRPKVSQQLVAGPLEEQRVKDYRGEPPYRKSRVPKGSFWQAREVGPDLRAGRSNEAQKPAGERPSYLNYFQIRVGRRKMGRHRRPSLPRNERPARRSGPTF